MTLEVFGYSQDDFIHGVEFAGAAAFLAEARKHTHNPVRLGGKRNGAAAAGPTGTAVLHDSCVFARHEGAVEEPRMLLGRAGVTVLEPLNSRRHTWCCGGPAESLYPDKALAIARERVHQLRSVCDQCVTMCPLCLVNLKKAADGTVSFRDISEVLLEASERAAAPTAAA